MTGGMTPIVKNTTRLVSGFIAVFGIYVALTGHLSPGGGFAGGVILAAAAILVILAFGRAAASRVITKPLCHMADAGGAIGFLVVAVLGYLVGGFFVNFLPTGSLHHLASGGTIPLSNLAILVKVGAGLAGAFMALAAYRRPSGDTTRGIEMPPNSRAGGRRNDSGATCPPASCPPTAEGLEA